MPNLSDFIHDMPEPVLFIFLILICSVVGWFWIRARLNEKRLKSRDEVFAENHDAESSTKITDARARAEPELNHSQLTEHEQTKQQTGAPAPTSLKTALASTRNSLLGRITGLFSTKQKITFDEREGIEEILYTSDLGPKTVQRLLTAVDLRLKMGADVEELRLALRDEMLAIFAAQSSPASLSVKNTAAGGLNDDLLLKSGLRLDQTKPVVLMIVGVNGAGKTTTIGKLSRSLAQSGRRVLVAAGDTFRAAASDQLKIWTERAQVEIFHAEGVMDPSAVAYQAIERAKAQTFDVVIIDTAGRLHTQKNLMEELKKMKRVMAKVDSTAPHEILLVLDANSGQNALVQAREFNEALGVSGVILTKLDGTAKGGVAVGIAGELNLPIKLIGVGEGIDDLRRFSPTDFVDSIL